MKFFTPTALLAAALVSAVVALPFLPAAKMQRGMFMLEAQLTSTAAGNLQVFFDDGTGHREENSSRVAIAAHPTPVAYRWAIPPGTYRGLRLDPLERGGTVVISRLRLTNPLGRDLASLALGDFKPSQQIASLALRDGSLAITSEPRSDDPQAVIAFSPPLVVRPSWRDYTTGAPVRIGAIFAGLALLLLLLDRLPRLREALAECARGLARRPARAVATVAALAVIASTYPIVFLGKSFVSPNLGTALLYDEYPTLPGYTSNEVADVKLSDIGAVMWQHVPFSMMQRRALGDGELPLWNRYNAAGVPLLAQGQSMFGDPLHFLVIAANGTAWAWDVKYLVAKWLFALGLGLTVLALLRDQGTKGPKDQETKGPRDEGTKGRGGHATVGPGDRETVAIPGRPQVLSSLGPLVPSSLGPLVAALLVALAAPFVGFFLYRVNHPAFFSLCYAPWPLYCLLRLAQATTRRGLGVWAAGLLVANLALMNSGTVKEAYMLLVCVNFSGGCVVLATVTSWRERFIRVAVIAWTAVVFVLLTTPIWATFLQTLRGAYTGYNAASAYQIQPTLLLGAFDEIFFRPLMAENRVFSPSLNFLLLLGVLYFLVTLRKQFAHRAVLALAASSLLPLSLAFGLIPPQWIVTLPFLSNIAHLDNTFLCVLIVLWSIVAGVGFAAAAERLGTREGRHDLILAGLLLFALVFGWIAFRQAAHRPILGPTFSVHPPGQVLAIHPFLWNYLVALLVAAVALALLLQGALVRRTFGPARALLVAACVATLLWRHGLHANSVGFDDFTSRPTVRVDFHAKSEAMQFARAAQAREPSRGYGLHGNFFPGWTGVYDLETVHGPDALVNPWLRELVTVSGVERIWDWRIYSEAATVGKGRPFFDALNVRYYFDRRSDQGALGQSLRLVRTADLDIYESPTAWPRAFFTDRVDTYAEPAELAEKIGSARGQPFAAVQRSDTPAVTAVAGLAGAEGARTVVPATNYRLTGNSTAFTVQASGPGVVALLETYWRDDIRAEVNGQRSPVLRLNHAFRGVVIPAAGEYRVTFRYHPRHFSRYLTLSALGALLGLGSLGLALRPARPA